MAPDVQIEGLILVVLDKLQRILKDNGILPHRIEMGPRSNPNVLNSVFTLVWIVFTAQVPLPHVACGISVLVEQIGERSGVLQPEIIHVIRVAGRMTARHKTGSARIARGAGDIESNVSGSFRGQPIYVGSAGVRVVVASEITKAHVLRQNDDEVGPLILRNRGFGRGWQQQGEGSQEHQDNGEVRAARHFRSARAISAT